MIVPGVGGALDKGEATAVNNIVVMRQYKGLAPVTGSVRCMHSLACMCVLCCDAKCCTDGMSSNLFSHELEVMACQRFVFVT